MTDTEGAPRPAPPSPPADAPPRPPAPDAPFGAEPEPTPLEAGSEAAPVEAGPEPAPSAPPAKLTERPHPLTPLIRGWVVLLAIILGVGREFIPDGTENGGLPPVQFLLAGIGLVALVAVAAGFLSWRFTRFVVDAEELRLDTGAIFRTSQRIAFERVQAIDVVQPFAARLFRLAELQIDIGGGESAKLRYLSLKRAYELRDYLLTRARGHRPAAVAADADLSLGAVLSDLNHEDEVLVRIDPGTLLVAAVTSHEFIGILLSGVVAIGITMVFDLGLASLGLLIPLGSALIGFVAQRVTGQFNYTLSRRPAGLRITRGLTSLTSQSLPARRVQAVQLSQSLIWRSLGLYRIDLEVVGWGAATDDENSRGVSTIMLPAGNADQVRIALAALWPTADYRQVPLAAAPPSARWLHPLSAPFLQWGFDDRMFVAQHGWLVRRWQVVPHTRAQSVRISQGPISRRLGLADVAVHTAGMHLTIHAAGTDAAILRERLDTLQAHLHHRPEHDVSEPLPAAPAADVAGVELAPAWPGPDPRL